MNAHKLLPYLYLMTALFSMGGLKQNQDPVAATAQTAPISLKQKIEENKDGVKGAPSPSMTFYGSQKILTSSPVKDGKKEDAVEESQSPEAVNEEAVEDDDSWEVDSETVLKKDQESTRKAVEEEDSWWSEDDSEQSLPDSQSESEF